MNLNILHKFSQFAAETYHIHSAGLVFLQQSCSWLKKAMSRDFSDLRLGPPLDVDVVFKLLESDWI